jgi:UDP-N-acetylmuramate--alanine ligase
MSARQRPWSGRRLHFVGVGGAGMSGYALAAHALGADVTGSDQAISGYAQRLRERTGVEVVLGHAAENVPPGDDVELVYSSAIPAENPEREAARARGLRELPRAELLHQLSALKRTIAVAGAHGKTTTASMIAHVLAAGGLDPSFLIGGVLGSLGTNAAWSGGEWLVVEADESDRSMLELQVEIAVVTNIELDHHATFSSLRELVDTFRVFLSGAPRAVIWDRPNLLELRQDNRVTYEVENPELGRMGSRFIWRGHTVNLPVPGTHNARNATAALEVASMVGVDPVTATDALATFGGVGRRFERLGTSEAGAVIYDDYAHHPTEVRVTLDAARTIAVEGQIDVDGQLLPKGRLVVAFQPHLFSRTAALSRDFAAALAEADVIVVLDVYPARERAQDWPGVSGRTIVNALRKVTSRSVYWEPTHDQADATLRSLLKEGDLCIVMGAGDVDALGRSLVSAPGERPADASAGP